MDWDKTKDALLCAAGSAAIWIFCQMRTDFQDMTKAVGYLTTKLEIIANELNGQQDSIRDHERRLRRVEHSKPSQD